MSTYAQPRELKAEQLKRGFPQVEMIEKTCGAYATSSIRRTKQLVLELKACGEAWEREMLSGLLAGIGRPGTKYM